MFSALAFTFLMLKGLYPPELKSTNLDFDWAYRKLLPKGLRAIGTVIGTADQHIRGLLLQMVSRVMKTTERLSGMTGVMARTQLVGSMASYVVGLLAIFLLLYYISR